MNQEQLLMLWLDTKPTAKSPYAIEGYPPMWETLRQDNMVLFTCPKNVMHRDSGWEQYREVPGLSYQWQKDGKWIGQGCQTTFDDFEKHGARLYS